MVHESLNGRRGWPIVVVRKQTINKDGSNVHMFENYINSVGASEKQIEMIHKYARNGNIILFGET